MLDGKIDDAKSDLKRECNDAKSNFENRLNEISVEEHKFSVYALIDIDKIGIDKDQDKGFHLVENNVFTDYEEFLSAV